MLKSIKILCAIIVAVTVFGTLIFSSLLTNIPVGHIGVRIQQYKIPGIGDRGVVKEDFKPGWHRKLGPIDSWVVFDSTVQTLEMTRDPDRGSKRGRDDVQVQSADGYSVSVDVTIKYRIMEGNTYKLYQDTGSGVKYRQIVRTEAQQACMAVFGSMKTEDFYNPYERRKKTVVAMGKLKKSLSDNYVEVIDMLIRDVKFDPEYENKIRRKKLADQEVELNKSLAASQRMAGKTQVIVAETKKKVSIIKQEMQSELVTRRAAAERAITKIKADAEKYSVQKKADADLIAAQNQAKGTLLVKKAEADGEKARNKAMQGVGGSVIVALEAARNLEISDVEISTVDVDILDLDAMAKRLGVKK